MRMKCRKQNVLVDLVAPANSVIKELIERRRRQVIVHSVLYYTLDENIIDDHTFDRWCKELVTLQEEYPELASECVYADEFKGYDGSTGMQFKDIPWACISR
jgi:NAD-dependent DNA ligase